MAISCGLPFFQSTFARAQLMQLEFPKLSLLNICSKEESRGLLLLSYDYGLPYHKETFNQKISKTLNLNLFVE